MSSKEIENSFTEGQFITMGKAKGKKVPAMIVAVEDESVTYIQKRDGVEATFADLQSLKNSTAKALHKKIFTYDEAWVPSGIKATLKTYGALLMKRSSGE